MSDLMLLGILRMPMPEIPNPDEVVAYTQFVSTARQAAARIEELERELAEAHRASAEWQQNFETLCRAVVGNTGLSAIGEVRKLKRDAERLRWLKENASDIRWEGHHVVRATMHCLDASIGASMKEGK